MINENNFDEHLDEHKFIKRWKIISSTKEFLKQFPTHLEKIDYIKVKIRQYNSSSNNISLENLLYAIRLLSKLDINKPSDIFNEVITLKWSFANTFFKSVILRWDMWVLNKPLQEQPIIVIDFIVDFIYSLLCAKKFLKNNNK